MDFRLRSSSNLQCASNHNDSSMKDVIGSLVSGWVMSLMPLEVNEMGFSIVSAVRSALNVVTIKIESSFTSGFAGTHLLGNTAELCQDGKERARAALENLGYRLPARKLLINITPADVLSDGNQLDLPFALSIARLISEIEPKQDTKDFLFAAELGINGELRPVKGVVSYAIAAVQKGIRGIVVAQDNLKELAVLKNFDMPHLNQLKIYGFSQLSDVLHWIWTGDESAAGSVGQEAGGVDLGTERNDFDDMLMTSAMESAAMAAALGQHSMLLLGVPGTGKSMFAQRLVSILPTMEEKQHLESLCIHNCVNERVPARLLAGIPPFRAPHHQASSAAVLGGLESPGELSLAHGGILFLDEFPEFRRDVLEALREPLESGSVQVARAHGKVAWHARTMLVAAANRCPCGWLGSRIRACNCTSGSILAYRNRLSGPILERIDMHLSFEERKVDSHEFLTCLMQSSLSGRTSRMRASVMIGRDRARRRNHRWNVESNRELPPKSLVQVSGLTQNHFDQLIRATIPTTASNRNIVKAIRVARSLADLNDREEIDESDLKLSWGWQAEPAIPRVVSLSG
jgi:magnesium chelatase family protein